MSDDYSDSPNGSSPSGENAPQIANAALRIAVTSRSADAANSILQEVRRRIAKNGEFIVLPSEGADAGAAIFHLTAEDLASDDAARSFSVVMFRSAAPLNFLVRALGKDSDETQRRLNAITGEMKKRTGFLQVPMSKPAGEAQSEEDTLLFQARGIASQLLSDPPPLCSVALSEFASHEKVARQGAKTAKKSSKRDGKAEDVSAAEAVKRAAREKSSKKRGANVAGPTDIVPVKDKASRKAEKALNKAERKSERQTAAKPDITATAVATPPSEGGKKDRSAKKAAKAAAKEARANKRENRKSEKAKAAAEPKEQEKKDKSADKAQRKARKAAAAESNLAPGNEAEPGKRKKAKGARKEKRRRRKESGEPGVADKAERKKAKSEKKEKRKRKGRRGAEDGDASRPLSIALKGMDEAAAVGLRSAMERYLAGAAPDWSPSKSKADIAVYAFDDPSVAESEILGRAAAIAQDNPKLRIFLERGQAGQQESATTFAAENRAIALLAGSFESPFIALDTKLRRYGADKSSTADVLAASILGIAAGGQLPKRRIPRPAYPPPPDLTEARALAATPREFLSQLSWNESKAPRLLWTHASKESAEAFMDRKIVLSEEQTLDITVPIAWPEEVSGRSSVGDAFGLEFLAGPLNYWYSKANGRDSRKVAEVDVVLKKRGATASQILSQAGAIIADFVTTHPLSSSMAWEESPVSRRARVLALYVLCCKMAIKRKIRFDEAVCAQVILCLLDLIEVLRSEDFYTPCSFDGMQQDCLVIGLALVLRGTAYAEGLLQDGLERLKTLQLDPGLTADGVWRLGSFSDHCALLAQFRTLISDFDRAEAALLEPVAAAAKKMTVFAEAMQKSNGAAPAFDDSGEKSFTRKLSGTRRALAGAGFSKNAPQKNANPPRMTDTYVFRDAQYFVSHSTQKVVPESSVVILHADPVSFAHSDPGGVTLAFAYGPTDILIRAEPQEGGKRRGKELKFDPALRNGYRIDGVGFESDSALKPNAARLEKSWRGPGWAAARSVDEINPAGSVTRTVIHLKAEHALIVVDELAATGGAPADFEQFWHIAPGLTAPQSGSAPYRFNLAAGGGITAMFDAPGDFVMEPEGEGTFIRRTLRVERGITAALFQWSAEPATLTLQAKSQNGGWSIECSGTGFDAQLQLTGDELRYTTRAV